MRSTASGQASITLRPAHVQSWICVCQLETQTPGSSLCCRHLQPEELDYSREALSCSWVSTEDGHAKEES